MIRLWYLTNIDLQSPKAHVFNIVKTCEALEGTGKIKSTLLLVKKFSEEEKNNFFSKHGISGPFQVLHAATNDREGHKGTSALGSKLAIINASFLLIKVLWKRRDDIDVIYFRDHTLLLVVLFIRFILRKPIVYESHFVLRRKFGQFVTTICVRGSNAIVAISESLKKHYAYAGKPTLVSYCGAIDPKEFGDATLARREDHDLPKDAFLFGYTGNLGLTGNYDRYKLDTIIGGLAHANTNVHLVYVGERDNNADWLRKKAHELHVGDRLHILPWQARNTIPSFLKMFDALVLPKREHDLPGDSPLKLFEYLNVGKPIVSGDGMAIVELLEHMENAYIVPESEGTHGWGHAFNTLNENEALRSKLSNNSQKLGNQFTWSKRGDGIADFVIQTVQTVT